mmetsp:Transcript_10243/g.15467  ORF Transcript_10243/g.15467 Transcript_10243/m.15467 type:complete len:759 (+) Transcript_10243:150-2426(+)
MSNNRGVSTVTPERKHDLLMEARYSRLSWVQSSSIPYNYHHENNCEEESGNKSDDGTNTGNGTGTEITDQHAQDPFSILNSSPLCQKLPSMIPLLRSLLLSSNPGDFDSNASNFKRNGNDLLSSPTSAPAPVYLKTLDEWRERIEAKSATQHRDQLVGALDDHAFLFYYKEVVDRLCIPESMDVVQGMRSFVRSFQKLGNDLYKSSSSSLMSLALVEDKTGDGDGKQKKQQQQQQDMDKIHTLKNETLQRLVLSIQKYLSSLHESLSNHNSWREGTELSTETKMMLDTFIYSKCHGTIMKRARFGLLLDDVLHQQEEELSERLNFLQFVNPAHLEIGCFMDIITNMNNGTSESENDGRPQEVDNVLWKSGLSLPITLMQSLEHMYSPAQMLRCILEVYRGVNNALQIIMEQQSSGSGSNSGAGSGSGGVRSPSADDVLPTLILSIISAKPRKLLTVLRFLEHFATEEQLRGEAGYAYTNLFSATQFIRELDFDLDVDDGSASASASDNTDNNDVGGRSRSRGPSLSIAPEELKAKLAKFRQDVDSSRPSPSSTSTSCDNANGTDNGSNSEKPNTSADNNNSGDRDEESRKVQIANDDYLDTPIRHVNIPVKEVAAARDRGEDLTEWAKNYAASSVSANDFIASASGEETGQINGNIDTEHVVANGIGNGKPLPLPDGFTRAYTFLATEPDDIRMSDVSSLLEEYRMLVRTTEILIMERDALANKQHALAMKHKKERLDHTLAEAASAMNTDTDADRAR